MAKKNKRQSNSTAESNGSKPAESASRTAGFASSARSTDKEFNPDYSYVVKDLKRIGTLAGIFFAVLIALSFIL
jgi:hypothetical protein